MAKEEGLTEVEIGAVEAIVMAVSAGRVRAQFLDAVATSHEVNLQDDS